METKRESNSAATVLYFLSQEQSLRNSMLRCPGCNSGIESELHGRKRSQAVLWVPPKSVTGCNCWMSYRLRTGVTVTHHLREQYCSAQSVETKEFYIKHLKNGTSTKGHANEENEIARIAVENDCKRRAAEQPTSKCKPQIPIKCNPLGPFPASIAAAILMTRLLMLGLEGCFLIDYSIVGCCPGQPSGIPIPGKAK
ncbi:hypothetical protein OUZ56_003742 [Daphnia magna]|uniref:Uncharacterized protein n=1 Tax=Daphnia magna TaxID=35525 RepID=A0ABR0A9U9_9CRUS|nr:hypothetical protein OUZ56_003742 [Daphnia magna]